MEAAEAPIIALGCSSNLQCTVGGKGMKGVQFLVDDNGQKTAVVINLKRHSELWEDFYDSAVARCRDQEPRESLESVKKRLLVRGRAHLHG